MEVWLREITPEDGKNIISWRNSLKVISHCMDKTLITEETNKQFFNDKITSGEVKQFIVEKSDDGYEGIASYPIGTMYFKDIDNVNAKCELGVFPGDKDDWNSECQRIAVFKMLDKAFLELHLNKVYVYVFDDCIDEVEMMKLCGFKIEGHFISEILDGEIFRSVIRLAVINDSYKSYTK